MCCEIRLDKEDALQRAYGEISQGAQSHSAEELPVGDQTGPGSGQIRPGIGWAGLFIVTFKSGQTGVLPREGAAVHENSSTFALFIQYIGTI